MVERAKDRARGLEARVKSIDEEFERELRARGFDPAQAENIALPTAIAQLYLERQLLLEQLNDIDSLNPIRTQSEQ